MGDALVDLARRQLTTGDLPDSGGIPTQVIVTMTLDQLTEALDHTDQAGRAESEAGSVDSEAGAAEIVGGTIREPMSAQRARRLACDARILPSVMTGASVILDHGAARRTASVAQRIALALRDKGCTAPFCDRPAAWCEAHHLFPWRVSQKTDLDNLALVCDAHHDLLHHDGWTITLENGRSHLAPTTPASTTPRTTRYRRSPRMVRRGRARVDARRRARPRRGPVVAARGCRAGRGGVPLLQHARPTRSARTARRAGRGVVSGSAARRDSSSQALLDSRSSSGISSAESSRGVRTPPRCTTLGARPGQHAEDQPSV